MDIYILFIVLLFILAISDLIVGVSNDAVNFMVSAIGSKAAPFWIIMLVASLGIMIGATFSSGMMEVARKGIFHPGMFVFSEIMVIFLAVMLTDILLLDLFNTFGMPTSTTVSIVFELLGGAVAVALLKIAHTGQGDLSEYINSAKALAIISGILLSIVVAFSVGAVIQVFSRILFSFKTDKTLKYFGSIYGGIAISAITYFILIKGLSGTSFASYEVNNGETLTEWVKHSTFQILIFSFVIWTVVLQIMNWIFKVNVLKIVVLAGTFALAMAFAGNDLVNFIGVPLAGLKSFEAWKASGEIASNYSMHALADKVSTPTLYLLIAGVVMVGALVFSKKARSVTQTSLDLSRQDEGQERFSSSLISRLIVRIAVSVANFVDQIIPQTIKNKIGSRFIQSEIKENQEQIAEFDLIRASVNLMVASILISMGTSMKLPLSTTYVTFMVAMGSSLSDGAWGRESAVYRITGVVSVVGGWFLTAFIAFTVAFMLALIISWAHMAGIILVLGIVLFSVIKSHKKHKQSKDKVLEDAAEILNIKEENEVSVKVKQKCVNTSVQMFENAMIVLPQAINGLINENRKDLKEALDNASELNQRTRKRKANSYKFVLKLQQEPIEAGHYYLQFVDYQKDFISSVVNCVHNLSTHVNNNHKKLKENQSTELVGLAKQTKEFLGQLNVLMLNQDYTQLSELINAQQIVFQQIEQYHKNQVKRIKNKEVGTRNSMLFMNTLAEFRNILQIAVNVYRMQGQLVCNTYY